MAELIFTTTKAWNGADGFGCASLGLAGVCDSNTYRAVRYPKNLEGVVLTGSYNEVLCMASEITDTVYVGIVLFGNAGGENWFLRKLHRILPCPMVGGGAAIDTVSGRSALITGGGEVAVFLITDDRFVYETETKCIHNEILETCRLEFDDLRILSRINGVDAVEFLADRKVALGLPGTDFEHLTLSDKRNINAHLSLSNGLIISGRDLEPEMYLRYISHADVSEAMRAFYDDEDAIVFGCAGLSGLLDRPLETGSIGLFLFGEVCTANGVPEFGNLMLSKLRILPK